MGLTIGRPCFYRDATSVKVRPCAIEDIHEVEQICKNLYGSSPHLLALLETSLLCLSAVDSENGHVVGFLCLNDGASIRFGSHSMDALPWLKEQPASLAMDKAFITVAAMQPDHEVEASAALLRAAFLAVSSMKKIVLATDRDVTFTEPGLGSILTRTTFSNSLYLYEASREAALPPLTIRRSTVEDHDDMVPIMESSALRYPALSRLPESCHPEEAFALTRLVSSQDERNCVLVAVADKKLVGFMVITSEVDTNNLLGAFDLHPFDNFIPMDMYDAQYQEAKERVHAAKLEQLQEKIAAAKRKDAKTETDDLAEGEEKTGAEDGIEASETQAEEEEEQQQQQSEDKSAELSFDLEPAAMPSEEEIRDEILRMNANNLEGEDRPNTLFAITMLCVEEPYELQAMELLNHAFEAFSEKDYCVVTLPHDSAEPGLLSRMTRLPPLSGASFPEVLYLINRNALLDGFEIRRAVEEDFEGVKALVSGMQNSEDIDRKQSVNAQIVVVGASECGLSAVEQMLLHPYLSYNYITLLAPGGISVSGPACEYTASLVARLGLEAGVHVLDGELVSLEVEQRVAELSDGVRLAYDLLLVTSGLQEQTRGNLGAKDPEAASIIFNAAELESDMTPEDASGMRNLCVYGLTLEAFHSLSILERCLALDRTAFVASSDQAPDPLVDILLQCCQLADLELQKPKYMTLTNLKSIPGSSRPHAYFEGVRDNDDYLLDLLVACLPRDVSPWIFSCLNDAGIVYDGRIVVDAGFRTSNPNIYAAGAAAKLSRRFGHNVHFEHYNSKECGAQLARSVATIFLGSKQPDQAPMMRAAKVVGCELPKEHVFLFAGVPMAMMKPSFQAPPGGKSITTATASGLLHLCFDLNKKVYNAVYLGKKGGMQASVLSSLVGLPNSYLNNVLVKHEAGHVQDLVEFFRQPWSELLSHDGFKELRDHIMQLASSSEPMQAVPGAGDIRDMALMFLNSRPVEFPSFVSGLQDPALKVVEAALT
ncbi:hypothetical protein CEUSTIGMA_g2928.t1 [Chlamydomonas eustigma]|uniref:Uncharacterized protein n=1 Tax=Chlamydomonas eustigma TaxID=1157962 RepID=A0A250WXH0_9CHLO|nr:hypothetical protein CEUSTIGMA_g2928.t1 [Chlamydomonas eustigma]|eukprot:GAX75485.1 hypothetical protein CEUSTIGMA_g2928.t1 [Chlamydomonas eustigma]